MNFTFLYVAAIYFTAVALWRRWRSAELPWRVAIFFYALVTLFLFRPLTQNYVNVPADYLNTLYPWRGVAPDHTVQNFEINDVILQMVPWAHEVRESWKRGEVPLWNGAAGGGYPLLANGQSAALSPFRLIALPLSLGNSFTCEAALKILVALTGAFLFLRRRLPMRPSLIGSIVYGFNSFIVVWLHFPHSSVAALLPASFFALELLFERPTHVRFIGSSLLFATIFLGGHPESAAHVGFACALFLGWLVYSNRDDRWTKGAIASASAVVGLLLAAPFIIPFFEALPRSQRYELLQQGKVHGYSPNVPAIVQLFQPRFFGWLKDYTSLGPGFAEMICGSAGVAGFVGLMAALARLVRRRRLDERAFFVIAFVVVAGVALSWPGFFHAFEALPLFSLAANARLRLVLCWFSAILAAYAVEALWRERRLLRAGVVVMLLLFAIAFAAYLPNRATRFEAFLTSLPALAVLATLLGASYMKRQRFAQPILLVLVTLELWTFALNWNATLPGSELFPPTPLTKRIAAAQRRVAVAGEPFRVTGLSAAFFPNSSAMIGAEDIRAHDPMANGRVLGVLRALTRYTSHEYFGMLPNADHRLIDFMNVRFLVTSPRDSVRHPKWRARYVGRDGKLFENSATLPRFFAAQNVIAESNPSRRFAAIVSPRDWRTVFVESMPPQLKRAPFDSATTVVRTRQLRAGRFHVDVRARNWSFVASSQPAFPGWIATRNGNETLPLVVINDAFYGFVVPPGHSTIDFTYRPRSFTTGIAAALLAITMLIGARWPLRRYALIRE